VNKDSIEPIWSDRRLIQRCVRFRHVRHLLSCFKDHRGSYDSHAKSTFTRVVLFG